MTEIILYHEKLLSEALTFENNSDTAIKLFFWDEETYKLRNYSLKKLVFIYEAACDLGLEIFKGNLDSIIVHYQPKKIWLPYNYDPFIKKYYADLTQKCDVAYIYPQTFVKTKPYQDVTRFFKYWNKVKKEVFMPNGDPDL